MTAFLDLECLESIFVRGVRIILCVKEKGFQLNSGKEVAETAMSRQNVDELASPLDARNEKQ